MKKRVIILISIVSIMLIIIIVRGWFILFGYSQCTDWDCFNENLKLCKKTNFIGGKGMIFGYSILGEKKNECRVDVMLLQGELSNKDYKKLEGEKMICSIPKGVVMLPESDLQLCHGLLKESLQELIIEKLHAYLVKNLGRINLEVLDAPIIDSRLLNNSNHLTNSS